MDTVSYSYGNSNWGDLLTAYNGSTVSSDAIGNILSDGTWTYTWEHGRELATMSSGGTTWTFTYDAEGMRTKRTNGSITYSYVYNSSQLSQMTVDGNTLYFAYDASGTPLSVTYNGTAYYYATNLQGDITAILNTSGTAVVTYTYDAWGKPLTIGDSMASTLGTHNPLRYRGYVYDTETGLYYLQSRYYDPEMGRFISADTYAATGQGILGNNMFAYCLNNPVIRVDPAGYSSFVVLPASLAKGLNLPLGEGIPINLNGTTYYYYAKFNNGGYLYEYWYDTDSNLIWIRHHTDHNRAHTQHSNPHDHEGKKDKDGYNTEDPTPLPKNDNFKSPKEFVNVSPELKKGLGYAATGIAIGFAVYQVIKWTGATLLAPVSGGTSYIVAGVLP